MNLLFNPASVNRRSAKIAKNYDSPFDWNFYNSLDTNGAPIYFHVDNGTERAQVIKQLTDNHCIGTTSPTAPLNVIGNANVTGQVIVDSMTGCTAGEPVLWGAAGLYCA